MSRGAGCDTLTGGLGRDAFAIGIGSGGLTINLGDVITDSTNNQDVIDLIATLTFNQLNIIQGTGEAAGSTVIQYQGTGEYLAVLQNLAAGTITAADFV